MRYFFNVQDGRFIPDEIGSVLPDMAAVREEALLSSAALLKALGRDEFWDGQDWSMHVVDEDGAEILTLRFSGIQLRPN